jgi:ribonuclease-3
VRFADRLSVLESALDYHFQDKGLLAMALTHRSFCAQHNERLEFLGDGVLNCVIAAVLFDRFRELPEGDLSRLRSHLVKQDALHNLARQLHLSEYLQLGDGEVRSGGGKRPSILADALEAIFGAIYQESGFDRAFQVIHRLFAAELDAIVPGVSMKDAKTRLQEWLQGRHLPLPLYQLLGATGAAHDQRFLVACQIEKLEVVTEGTGTSRRLAEQESAAKALTILGVQEEAPL